jgi:hypothetical protein
VNPRTAHRSTHRLASLGWILALLLLIAAPVAPAAGVTGPDVVITKSADASSINSSSTLHYTLTARNTGDASATGVVVTDNSIDFNDLQITGLSTTQGSCSPVGAQNDITCAIGTLNPAQQAVVGITAQSKQSTCDGTVRNSARVAAGNEPAANQTNNSSTPVVVVTITDCSGTPTAGVDVTITKHASASTIAANGAALNYTLTANNDGTQATANGAVLRVTDNSIDFNDLQITGVTTSAGSCTVSTLNDVSCTLPPLAAGANHTITIHASSKAAGVCDGTVRNSANVYASDEPPGNRDNNSSTPTTVVTITGCTAPPPDTTPPTGTFTINANAPIAYGAVVRLYLDGHDTGGTSALPANTRVSNSADASGGVLVLGATYPYGATQIWNLTAAAYGGTASLGTKTVFVQYQDAAGNWSSITTDTITMVADAANTCAAAKTAPIRPKAAWQYDQIFASGDQDWFRFSVTTAGYQMITLGRPAMDYRLDLFSSSCTLLATSNTSGTGFERLYRTLPIGTYFVRAAGTKAATYDLLTYGILFQSLSEAALVLTRTAWIDGAGLHVVGEVLNNTAFKRKVTITVTYYNASNVVLGTTSAIAFRNPLNLRSSSGFEVLRAVPSGFHHYTVAVTVAAAGDGGINLPVTPGSPSGSIYPGSAKNTTTATVHNGEAQLILYDAFGRTIDVAQGATSPITLPAGASGTFSLVADHQLGLNRIVITASATP